MLSVEISIVGRIKQRERVYRALLKILNRKLQEAIRNLLMAITAVVHRSLESPERLSSSGIAKTIFPDTHFDYSRTFEHIRTELDLLYKEKNPIFNNSIAPEFWSNKKHSSFPNKKNERPTLVCIHHTPSANASESSPYLRNRAISPKGIAKTTLPENRPGFNETFLHIRRELDAIYREQNPYFTNTAAADLLKSSSATEIQTDTNYSSLLIDQILQNQLPPFISTSGISSGNSGDRADKASQDREQDTLNTPAKIHQQFWNIYQATDENLENHSMGTGISERSTAATA